MAASIALICRQSPGTITKQGETMGFNHHWPGHLQRTCPSVDLSEIEWKSEVNEGAIPYGILIRVYDMQEAKRIKDEEDEYCSPVDYDWRQHLF